MPAGHPLRGGWGEGDAERAEEGERLDSSEAVVRE